MEGRIKPVKWRRAEPASSVRPRVFTVTKFVMITSSLGIIIRERNRAKSTFRPRNFSRAKAKAASTMTTIMEAVVITVKISVFSR